MAEKTRELLKLRSHCPEGPYYQEGNWSFCNKCSKRKMKTKILNCDKCNRQVCLDCENLHSPPDFEEDWLCQDCVNGDGKKDMSSKSCLVKSKPLENDDDRMDVCSICNQEYFMTSICLRSTNHFPITFIYLYRNNYN